MRGLGRNLQHVIPTVFRGILAPDPVSAMRYCWTAWGRYGFTGKPWLPAKLAEKWSAHPGGSDLPYENMQRPSYHKVTWGWMCCSAWHCATVCVPLCPMFWTWVVGHCWCVNLCSASFSLFFCRYVETTSDLTDSTESVAIPGDQTMSLKHIWPHASLPGRWNSDWRS